MHKSIIHLRTEKNLKMPFLLTSLLKALTKPEDGNILCSRSERERVHLTYEPSLSDVQTISIQLSLKCSYVCGGREVVSKYQGNLLFFLKLAIG